MKAPGHASNLDGAPVRPEDLVGYDMIRRLVAFPTVSRDSNLALIEFARDYLDGHGATTALTFDDEGRKANLFATLAAHDGNATSNGIVLSGHTDVVPVDGQPWDTDPFVATLDAMLRSIGHSSSPEKVFASFSIAGVASMVSLIPGGIGAFEGIQILMLGLLRVPVHAGLAATLMLRALVLWIPMIPGFFILRYESKHLVEKNEEQI